MHKVTDGNQMQKMESEMEKGMKRSSELRKAHCLSGAARYIADGKSTQEFEREGEEIKPELRTQKQARAESRRERCARVVIPAATCECSLRRKEPVGGHRESKREIGPQLPSTQDRKKGGNWATVAWRSPGLGLDIYN